MLKIVCCAFFCLCIPYYTDAATRNIVKKVTDKFDFLGSATAAVAAATGFSALLAPCCKRHGKRRRQVLRRNKKEVKFGDMLQATDGKFCKCGRAHRKSPHALGNMQSLRQIFPSIGPNHLHGGLTFLCLLGGCSADLFIPAVTPVVVGPAELSFTQVSLDLSIPDSLPSNKLHEMNLTADVDTLTFVQNPMTRNCTFLRPLSDSETPPKIAFSIRVGDIKFQRVDGRPLIVRNVMSANEFNICFRSQREWHALKYYPPESKQTPVSAFLITEPFPPVHLSVANTTFVCFDHNASQSFVPKRRLFDRSLLPYMCNVYDLKVDYTDGQSLRINNALYNSSWLDALVRSQSLEVVSHLGKCRTQRCIGVRKPFVEHIEQKRQRRSLDCSGLFSQTCKLGLTKYEIMYRIKDQIKKSLPGVRKTIAETHQQTLKVVDLIRTTQQSLNEALGNLTTKINLNLDQINNELSSSSLAMDVTRSKLSLLTNLNYLRSNIFTAILSQRLYAVDTVNQYRFQQELLFAALDCAKGSCRSLQTQLSTMDLELPQLHRARFPFTATIFFGSDLSILYSKPHNYNIKLVSLPMKPYIAVAENCDGSSCKQCVQQEAMVPQINYRQNVSDLQGINKIQVTPFNVTSCVDRGQPDHQLLRVGNSCLRVSIDNTTEIDCPEDSHHLNGTSMTVFTVQDSTVLEWSDIPSPELNLHVKMNDRWEYVDISKTDLVRLEIESGLQTAMRPLDLSVARLSVDGKEVAYETKSSRSLAIAALVISICIGLGMAGQCVYLRYFWKTKQKPSVKFFGTTNPKTALLSGTQDTLHQACSYEATLLDGHTAILTLHGTGSWRLVQTGQTMVLNTPDGDIQTNIVFVKALNVMECSCLSLGLVEINRVFQPLDPSNSTIAGHCASAPAEQDPLLLPDRINVG